MADPDQHYPQHRADFEVALAQFLDDYAAQSDRPYWYFVLCAFDVVVGGMDVLDHKACLKMVDATLRIRTLGDNKPYLVARRGQAVKALLDAGDLARSPSQGSA